MILNKLLFNIAQQLECLKCQWQANFALGLFAISKAHLLTPLTFDYLEQITSSYLFSLLAKLIFLKIDSK